MIQQRLHEIEQGLFPPLIFNAEGGTTNGTSLLKFKKGAFVNLGAIQPKIIHYESPFLDLENSVISLYSHIILTSTIPYSRV